MSRWGATPSDLSRVMAGDSLLVHPTFSYTMTVIVNTPPEDIWPWLVQIGYQHGGLYSSDRLDRLFGYLDRPSATRILPEFQHLAVGDEIPLGRGPSWPVAVVEPRRALVLDMRNRAGFDWVWQFGTAAIALVLLSPRTLRGPMGFFPATGEKSAATSAPDRPLSRSPRRLPNRCRRASFSHIGTWTHERASHREPARAAGFAGV